MSARGLLGFFEERRGRGEPLVLVTVFDTRGSTYSKAGAHMLVAGDGVFHGMLSGGCLEGDLAIRAARVIETETPHAVDYDLAQDDELWGLGVGCDGLMRVFLQPLTSETGYQPFAGIAQLLRGDVPGRLATVIDSNSSEAPSGATALRVAGNVQATGMSTAMAEHLLEDERLAGPTDVGVGDCTATVLFAVLEPPTRFLVLGAGMDAEPVVRFAGELGWRCSVVDHREAYVERGKFGAAEQVLCMPADELATALDLSRFDAAIVMSHHLASDRSYLRQLAATDIAYVGLLGPAGRRERLVSELGGAGERLGGRLRGPAGLDIGGRGPAAIALSIIAEVQAVLQNRKS